MAELITVAGMTLTLPGLLSACWTVLKSAYDLYGQVDIRRMQIRVLLDRCADLILKITHYLSQPGVQPSGRITLGVGNLEEACEAVRAVTEKLQRKGFLWCMVNQDKIDVEIGQVEYKIMDAFAMFNFLAHISNDEIQQQLRRAREQDREQLNAKLDDLSANHHRIISTLQDHGGAQKRVEELLVDVLKCIRELGTEQTPKAKFLRSAGIVLQRLSKGRGPDISEEWVISSLDVDFEPADVIGQGSFGRVFKGRWKAARVAIKQMYIDDARSLSDADRKMMYKEAQLWSKLHHPNILHLYGACLEATSPFFVMQYCSFGNLCSYLVDHPDANRMNLVYDIVAGITYLHGRNIVHADLKGVNILVDNKHTALVTDFGLSSAIDGIRSRSTHSRRGGTRHGTLQWMAPEVLNGEKPSKASDIYGLALTIWEVFSGEIPFEGINDSVLWCLIVSQERRPPRPKRLEQDIVWDLIQQCWAASPTMRPNVQKVLVSISMFSTRLGSLAYDLPLTRGPSSSTSSEPDVTSSLDISQLSLSPAVESSTDSFDKLQALKLPLEPTQAQTPGLYRAPDLDAELSRMPRLQNTPSIAIFPGPDNGFDADVYRKGKMPMADTNLLHEKTTPIHALYEKGRIVSDPTLLSPKLELANATSRQLPTALTFPQRPQPQPLTKLTPLRTAVAETEASSSTSTGTSSSSLLPPLAAFRDALHSRSHDRLGQPEQKQSRGFWEQWVPAAREDRNQVSQPRSPNQDSILSQMIHILALSNAEDFSLSMALDASERASVNEANALDAVNALGQEFRYGSMLQQLSAAKLWAIMLRNTSEAFLRQCLNRGLLDAIEHLFTNQTASPVVRERVLNILAATFYECARHKLYYSESGFNKLQGLWHRYKPLSMPDEGSPFDDDDPIFYPPKGRHHPVVPDPIAVLDSKASLAVQRSLAPLQSKPQVRRPEPEMLTRYLEQQQRVPAAIIEEKKSAAMRIVSSGEAARAEDGLSEHAELLSVRPESSAASPTSLKPGVSPLVASTAEHSRAVEGQMLTYLLQSNEILARLLRSNGYTPSPPSPPSSPPPEYRAD